MYSSNAANGDHKARSCYHGLEQILRIRSTTVQAVKNAKIISYLPNLLYLQSTNTFG